MSRSEFDVLRISTGMWRRSGSLLISSSTARPSIFGRFKSSSTRSGRGASPCRPHRNRNSSASSPSSTTCRRFFNEPSWNACRIRKTSPGLSSTRRMSIASPHMRLLLFLVPPEFREYAEVLQRRCVSLYFTTRREFAQEPSHDLSAARLRKRVREPDIVGLGQRADLFPDPLAQLLFQPIGCRIARLKRDKRRDPLPLDRVRPPHHGCFRHLRMRHQRRFHLHRAQPVPRYVDHVVDPPHHPEIAILIAPRAVAREINARNLRPVLLLKPLRIAVDGPQHGRPGTFYYQITAAARRNRFALPGNHIRRNPRQRQRRRARLRRRRARQRRNHDHPGFRLPPRIDDRAAVAADHVAIPHPRFRIDRLAHRP